MELEIRCNPSFRILLSEAIESNRLTGDPANKELEEMRKQYEESIIESQLEEKLYG